MEDWIDIRPTRGTPPGRKGRQVTLAWRRFKNTLGKRALVTLGSEVAAELGWRRGRRKVLVTFSPALGQLRLVPDPAGHENAWSLYGPKNARLLYAVLPLPLAEPEARKAERIAFEVSGDVLILTVPEWARAVVPAAAAEPVAPEPPPPPVIIAPAPPPPQAPPPQAPPPQAPPASPPAAARPTIRTPERDALLCKLWPGPLSLEGLRTRLNALPGPRIGAGPGSVMHMAEILGLPLPRRSALPPVAPMAPVRAIVPMPPPAPPRAPAQRVLTEAEMAALNRKDVTEMLFAGMGARAIAEDLGIGLNDVSNLIASIRAEQQAAKESAA